MPPAKQQQGALGASLVPPTVSHWQPHLQPPQYGVGGSPMAAMGMEAAKGTTSTVARAGSGKKAKRAPSSGGRCTFVSLTPVQCSICTQVFPSQYQADKHFAQ